MHTAEPQMTAVVPPLLVATATDPEVAPAIEEVSTPTATTTDPEKSPEDFPAIEPDAWSGYQKIRGFLPLALATRIAKALGRPISGHELSVLVQGDGPECVCDACGKQFQPVRFAYVSDDFLDAVNAKKALPVEEEISYRGSAIVCGYSVLRFCGPFFAWNKQSKNQNGEEWFGPQKRSCLGSAFLHEKNEDPRFKRPRPTKSVSDAEALVARWREERQARADEEKARHQEHLNKVGDAFSRAGSNRPREWSPGRADQERRPRGRK